MKPGYSRDIIAANIESEMARGLSRREAAFNALCVARAAYFKRFPNGALPRTLAMPKTRLLREHYNAEGKPLYEEGSRDRRGPEARRELAGMKWNSMDETRGVSYAEHPAHA